MGNGLESLCGQAYGAKQYHKLSVHAYTALICLLLVCIPISLIWTSLGILLPLFGVDRDISHAAAKYVVCMIPALLASATIQPMLIFLQSQSLVFPMMLSAFLTLCIHVPLSWFFIFKSGLGFVGAALSISISYWINAIVLALYILCSRACTKTRAPISMEGLRICEFLRIALPSAMMTCLEEWSFELVVLLSGLLPNPELETFVLSICLSIISCVSMISIGLGAGASTRISHELGGGNPEAARRVVPVVLFIAVAISIAMVMPLLLLRGVLGYAYSSEKEVVAYIKQIAPLICLCAILDSFQGSLSGVARGCGWQHIGAYVNLVAYYFIGIPIGITLAFIKHLGGT